MLPTIFNFQHFKCFNCFNVLILKYPNITTSVFIYFNQVIYPFYMLDKIISNNDILYRSCDVTVCSPYCGCFGTCLGSPTKNFEIEHPLASDESPNKYNMKHLIHSTLEGPEYGVYYRGSAQLSGGAVKVDLPKYFDALAEKTDATVQLTPIGGVSSLTIKLTDSDVFGNNSFCVCTDDSGDQAQCFHWIVNGRRIDKHILCNIAQGDRPGACDDGRLCVERWEYRGEMENLNGIDTMTCADLDEFIEFNNTWDVDDSDFVTDYETLSKANKIIMILYMTKITNQHLMWSLEKVL